MRKDSYTTNEDSPWRSRLRWVVMACSVGIFIGAFFFAYQHKAYSQYYSVANGYLTRFTVWFAERKNHLHESLVKVKQLAVTKNNAEQEIHFEFYTALPSMQVSVSEPELKEEREVTVSTKKRMTSAKSMAANKPVISASEIEKELSTDPK